MKQLHILIILAIPVSIISGIGLTTTFMPSSSHISNEPPNHVAMASQIVNNNTFIPQDNGSVFAAINPNTNRIYVANEFSNTVSIIDGNNNTKIASIPVDSVPLKLAVNPVTNRIYVVTEYHVINNIQQNGTVIVIDGNNNTKIASILVGENPSGIAVNSVTNRIYTANYIGCTVSVIDGNSNTVIGKPIKLDFGIEGIVVNPLTNKIYVANGITTTVYVIDGNDAGSKVDEIRKLFAFNVAVNPITNKIYVPSYFFNNLSVIDGKYNDIMTVIPIGKYHV